MKKTCSSKKSAFSLIELSIVLIIIGLLIAGITGGASLIKSSELRAAMSEARAFSTSVNGFYTQFNALPGDFATKIGTSGGGDADGHIEHSVTCAVASTSGNCGEGSNAWVQMLKAGTIDTNIVSSSATIAVGTIPTFGTNAPASKIKSSGWAFDYRDIVANSAAFGNEASSQNVIALTGPIGVATTTAGVVLSDATTNNVATAAILATDALSIDSKIDDGNAITGKVRGLNPASSSVPTSLSTTSTTNCYFVTTGTYSYNTTDTAKSCALTYQIDVNS